MDKKYLPIENKRNPHPLKNCLDNFKKSCGDLDKLSKINENWKNLIGLELFQECKPLNIEKKILEKNSYIKIFYSKYIPENIKPLLLLSSLYCSAKVVEALAPFFIVTKLKPSLILLDSIPLPNEKQLFQLKPCSKLASIVGSTSKIATVLLWKFGVGLILKVTKLPSSL